MTRLLRLLLLVPALLCATAAPAQAHPLGNFSVNHHDGLRLTPHGIRDTAVVDTAELPTAQDRDATDRDHDGRISGAEAAARASARCVRLAGATRLTVDGERIDWRVTGSALRHREGTGGLPVARLTCRLRADADLTGTSHVGFASSAAPERVGWKEITATGDGVRLTRSSVPSASPTGGLRHYPRSAQPSRITTAALDTAPGGADGAATGVGGRPGAGTAAAVFPGLQAELTGLLGGDLTPAVGLLAVALSLALGAGHAALPGHAKLAVGACLAQRTGGLRAALTVGATVTVTHTAGVLVAGLLLTTSAGLLGEQLLGWTELLSGALVLVIGGCLTASAVRSLRTGNASWLHTHHHHGHTHSHSHGSEESARGGTAVLTSTERFAPPVSGARRLPLLGIGLAGGLVPSPSALIILLSATALSHTAFGVLLVLGYGLGMAATLTAAGLVLAGGGTRLAALGRRHVPGLRRVAPYTTLLTALVVLAVGAGLLVRHFAG